MLASPNFVANPGNGELGWFMHAGGIVSVPMSAWGIATGIGLLRSWPWARVSKLGFSTLLAAYSTLAVVGFLSMPDGNIDMSARELLLLKTFVISLNLIPGAVGVQGFMYFRRDDVRANFHTSCTAKTASA